MISNYLKLAIRVLARKKFFTAITLFGISFTLAILMLIVSVMETEVGRTKPLTNKHKMVVLPSLSLTKQFYDTLYVYDTIMVDNNMTIDTSYTLEEGGSNNSNNQYAWWFLDKHFRNVPNAVHKTFFNAENSFNAYVNNSKVEMKAVYADHEFWDVLDFQFYEGFGFGKSSVDQEERVCVITTDLADRYFGRKSNVLDETLEMDGQNFKVMGLIEPAGVSLLSSDIILPYTVAPAAGRRNEDGFGGYMALFMGESEASVELIKDDIKFINSGMEVPPRLQDDYNTITTKPLSYMETYADQLLDMEDEKDSLSTLRWIMIGLLSLFILLPTLNLINLNVGRIMERSAEIGVRKAFGASKSVILTQFVIENIVQTFIGGVIGLGLALLMMYYINDAKLMGDITLKLNFRFFIISFFICLLFGILSGLLPAYKMSKLHVVTALKSK